MPAIKIANFEGTVPRVSPKLLQNTQAQIAKNVDIKTGKIKPLKDMSYVADANNSSSRSIFKLGNYWLCWDDPDISVVRSFIDDVDNRIYYTGDGKPKQTDETLATSGPPGYYPFASWRLGVPCPLDAPTFEVGGGAGVSVARSTAYVYTYVTGWGEESAPSDPTDVLDIEKIAQVAKVYCADASAFSGGEYFTLGTPGQDYYVWYYISGNEEITEIVMDVVTIPVSGGDYFLCSSPTTDYYVWYSIGGVAEVSEVTCNNQFYLPASGEIGAYWLLSSPVSHYYVWYERDGNQIDPGLYGYTGIKVAYVSGDSIADMAQKTANAIDGVGAFSAVSDGISKVTITNANEGAADDVANGTMPNFGSVAWTFTTIVQGIDPEGSDPALTGKTGVMVSVSSGAGNAEFADNTAAALEAMPDFTAVSDGVNKVTLTNNEGGEATDATDGPPGIRTGFTFTVTQQGTGDAGSDPEVEDHLGVKVTIQTGDTAEVVASATQSVLDALVAFDVTSDGNVVTVTNTTGGECNQPTSGNLHTFRVMLPTLGATNTAELSGFLHNNATDLNLTKLRIYRLNSGTAVAEFQYVDEIEFTGYLGATTYAEGDVVAYGTKYYKSLVDGNSGNTPGSDPTYWEEFTYTDTKEDTELGELLQTEGWDEPPADLQGLMLYMNSILVGFSGNQLYFSVPLYPYAWPDDYALSFTDPIVGIGQIDEYIVVLTEGAPAIVTGSDPETMSQTPLPVKQPALTQGGIVSSRAGVISTTEDGLFMVTGGGEKIITEHLYTKDQWMDLSPADLRSVFYDDRYFGFFEGGGEGIVLDFHDPQRITTFNISDMVVYNTYSDGDNLYILALDNDPSSPRYGTVNVYRWQGSATYLEAIWKSKQYQYQFPFSFAFGRVIADGDLTFKLYADGSLIHTENVTSDELFRLPSGRNKVFEIELTGESDVDYVAIANSPKELID